MPRGFIDTAAVVKLYRNEPDSMAVVACVDVLDELIIAPITPLEFHFAFAIMVRMGVLTEREARVHLDAFDNEVGRFRILSATESIFSTALSLVDTHGMDQGLRPLDAIQLASALDENDVKPIDMFITTDKLLATVASMEGFVVQP